MKSSGKLCALAAVVAALGVVPAPAGASSGPCPGQGHQGNPSSEVSYRFGGLSEAVLRVPVPVSSVRHLVPAHYGLLGEASGTAILLAAHGHVAALKVGCSDEQPATVSEYGVMIEQPPGADPGRHAYYVSLLTDDRRLVNRLRMLGLPAEIAEGSFLAQPDGNGGIGIFAEELWKQGLVRLEATTTEAPPVPLVPAAGVRFWFDGHRGTVLSEYECPACPARPDAFGKVWGSPGTTLDRILGGQSGAGRGFFIKTDLVATAQIVD